MSYSLRILGVGDVRMNEILNNFKKFIVWFVWEYIFNFVVFWKTEDII